MADFFQSYGIADLALGKPGIVGLPVSCTVGDVLLVLKELNLNEVSLWDCPVEAPAATVTPKPGSRKRECRDCECVGKVTFVDIVCHFAGEDKVENIEAAFNDPVSVLLHRPQPQIQHLSSNSRLLEAFDLVLDHGAQCFYVPLDKRRNKYIKSLAAGAAAAAAIKPSEKYKRFDYCCLTQEDVLRFLLGCIGVFCPMPLLSIRDLGIINEDVLLVNLDSKARDLVPLLLRASENMSAVAVVEHGEKFVGDISPAALRSCCDEKTLALALANLSVSDFWTFIHGDPHALKEVINSLTKTLSMNSEELKSAVAAAGVVVGNDSFGAPTLTDTSSETSEADMWDSSSEENISLNSHDSLDSLNSVESTGLLSRSGSSSCLSPLTCRPSSSLIAVMAQALAHRSSYVWVTHDDNTLIGMVTYVDMISALLNHVL